MPELPDVTVYIERCRAHPWRRRSSACAWRARSCCAPSIRRSPTLAGAPRLGCAARQAHRDRARGRPLPRHPPDDRGPPALAERAAPTIAGKIGLAAFDFPAGTLLLTEAGTKKRASLHLRARREPALAAARSRRARGARLPTSTAFRAALPRENHTLKRALTDPRILSGIGNAYSDEILHRARLSPVKLDRPAHATTEVARLSRDAARRSPTGSSGSAPTRATASPKGHRVPRRTWPCTAATASRARSAARPCSASCYADNETNYCARCQTGGRLLADRALSRLLKQTGRARSRSSKSAAAAVTRRRLRPRMAAVYARPMRDKPTLVLLVRHGLTPTTGTMLPGRAPGLHLSEGRQEGGRGARGAHRRAKAVAAVYASPLERAQETRRLHRRAARARRAHRAGPARVRHRRLDGLGDLRRRPRRPSGPTVQRYPSGFRFPGGESFVEIQTRMTTTIAALVARHPGETVVAVSHADPIKTAVAHALGTPLDLFQRIMIATALDHARSRTGGAAPPCSP